MRSGARVTLAHKDHEAATIIGARVMSTIVFHGDMDTTVHPDNGDRVLAQSASNLIDGQLVLATHITFVQGQTLDGHAYTRTNLLRSNGWYMAPATHGRAAAPPAVLPIRKARTPHVKCCVFYWPNR